MKPRKHKGDDIEADLGPCCMCEATGPTVRNLLTLHQRSATPGQGWGCALCRIGANGAMAVVCDDCLHADPLELDALRWHIYGYPSEKGRIKPDGYPFEAFDHDKRYHPETWRWYGNKDRERPCSLCGLRIKDGDEEGDEDEEIDVPLILFRGEGRAMQEARFHWACSPLGKALTFESEPTVVEEPQEWKGMRPTGISITPEELQDVRTARQTSGMALSGGQPMGDPEAVVTRLLQKYDMPADAAIDANTGVFWVHEEEAGKEASNEATFLD